MTSLFSVRPEVADDANFLFELYLENQREHYARLGIDGLAVLGEAMIRWQFDLRERAYRDGHPDAMRVIVQTAAGLPVGRFIVDWDENGVTHGVDLAVHPARRQNLPGIHLLGAWIATADRLGRPSIHEVMPDNPARLIYRRFGFVETDPDAAPVPMIRAVAAGRRPGA